MAKILIIEDSPLNMKLWCLFLGIAGHISLCATNAEAGLIMAVTERPDLILMDIQLPGMDGLAATRLLKQGSATANIPVVALTALALKKDVKNILLAGCDACITKPVHYKELYLEIDRLLAKYKLCTNYQAC